MMRTKAERVALESGRGRRKTGRPMQSQVVERDPQDAEKEGLG